MKTQSVILKTPSHPGLVIECRDGQTFCEVTNLPVAEWEVVRQVARALVAEGTYVVLPPGYALSFVQSLA